MNIDLYKKIINVFKANFNNEPILIFSPGRINIIGEHTDYNDGFVFGFYSENRPDLPAVATGGRYDALTRQLGHGREIPAVGGVIRPDLVVALGGTS